MESMYILSKKIILFFWMQREVRIIIDCYFLIVIKMTQKLPI